VTGPILVEVGAGELIDKITILAIKTEKISDPNKLSNIKREMDALAPAMQRLVDIYPEIQVVGLQLKAVNEMLWVIEDEIRACESRKDFGSSFVELARSVYHQNDKRAELKKVINLVCKAHIIEEKSYYGF